MENLKTRDQWEDQDVAGMIILKWILRNYRGTGFGWFNVGRCVGENVPLGSVLGRIAADL